MPLELQVGTDPVTRTSPFPVLSDLYVHEGTLTLDTNAYAAGDTLANLVEVTMPAGWTNAILHDVFVLDEDDQGIGFDLLVFNAQPVITAKNAAWATSDAHMRWCKTIVRVTSSDYVDLGINRVANVSAVARIIPLPTSKLWIGTVSQGTGTYSVNGLSLQLGFLR